jgi:plasmid maintenance system killer protein
MELCARGKDSQIALGSAKEMVRRFGVDQARLIQRRIGEMKAAASLEVLYKLPGPRCHELANNRAGQFSVDLVQPYRLIFEPSERPVPSKSDGGIDLSAVRSVTILEVTNYHD